ncbi:hypothetical protein Adu01nite_39390 [Paractinoplanes durhamensis]|uniref:Uncharacterized protein n=1 Tax=Paractinoplanes durhamensis TaxID=113563 RepID=A0ABQ3YYI8_9ACTN|nr:hypothetical protein Adu01nite_39390 [Actinoplanes durhamensis]
MAAGGAAPGGGDRGALYTERGANIGAMEIRRVAKRRPVSRDAVKRFAVRSTEASARLERRSVPTEYVRPPEVERLLAERQPQD